MGPFLWTGMIIAFFQASGKNAVENICLNMSANGKVMAFLKRLKSKSGSPSGPAERLHLSF